MAICKPLPIFAVLLEPLDSEYVKIGVLDLVNCLIGVFLVRAFDENVSKYINSVTLT